MPCGAGPGVAGAVNNGGWRLPHGMAKYAAERSTFAVGKVSKAAIVFLRTMRIVLEKWAKWGATFGEAERKRCITLVSKRAGRIQSRAVSSRLSPFPPGCEAALPGDLPIIYTGELKWLEIGVSASFVEAGFWAKQQGRSHQ
jgi:hypothetical protein